MITMRTSIRKTPHKYIFYATLFFSFLILSCGGSGSESAATTSWTIEQILSQNQSQESLPQTVEIRHCGGPAPQQIECPAGGAAQFTYDLSATNFSPATLDPGVRDALDIGASQPNVFELPLPAPGTIGQYEVRKQFTILRGEAFARSSNNEQQTLTYTYILACTIVTQSETTVDCETGEKVTPATTTEATASLPETTATPAEATAEAAPNTPTPSPTPTSTAISIGQNCATAPGDALAEVWAAFNTILGCATADVGVIPLIAEEAFQGGHLFWRNDTDEVYIIFDRHKSDGTELSEGLWELNPREYRWDGSDPDGIGLTPPAGLAEPKRGFGWLWRTHLGREAGPLGWALDREYGFENLAQAQNFEQGLIFRDSTARVYVLVNDGHFFSR